MNSKESKSQINPLGLDAKREKAGSDTYRKYNYQYHWAFCRMLDEHSEGNEYAIFIEEHEDVTLANSLNGSSALFEFNQIKEIGSKSTISSLTKDKEKTVSPLKKLASSVCNKKFSGRVSSVNFVSTGGFSFDLHKEGLSFEVIKVGQLTEGEKAKILSCISEIDKTNMLESKMAFIIPELPEKGFDLAVEGKISQLINKRVPGCTYNSSSIYSCIIRDLQRKGENSFDYHDWDDSLKKKAVTSKQLDEIIDQHVKRKPDENLTTELLYILKDEYNLNSLNRRNIVSAFDRYYTAKLSNRDSELHKVSEEIKKLIKEKIDNFSTAAELDKYVFSQATDLLAGYFPSREDFSGAFLYELVALK
ncbi:protein of unknown function [Allopseudospirillum japonicum]|uniref:CD-NTase associated protein 4-like DNA endonuclease domain-containing protein n=1 Tax=Allopseudospirillum japonicum TaxID=64971 RepID=A0A1H6QXL5_9GAMM|nr:DUF4297 domain-containing protein [Allopseudospirillum japonicum]SEI48359.1 protein of unknown function [Allopseudospirillum japonicum]